MRAHFVVSHVLQFIAKNYIDMTSKLLVDAHIVVLFMEIGCAPPLQRGQRDSRADHPIYGQIAKQRCAWCMHERRTETRTTTKILKQNFIKCKFRWLFLRTAVAVVMFARLHIRFARMLTERGGGALCGSRVLVMVAVCRVARKVLLPKIVVVVVVVAHGGLAVPPRIR